jgi:HD-GYP domain-containing protein (c-di-GMP phosphodiesterase class II)
VTTGPDDPEPSVSPAGDEVEPILDMLAQRRRCSALLADVHGLVIAQAQVSPICEEQGCPEAPIALLTVACQTGHPIVGSCRDEHRCLVHPVTVGLTHPGALVLCRDREIPPPTDELIAASVTCLAVLWRSAQRRADVFEGVRQVFFGAIKSLICAVDAKVPWARGHSIRVARYALAIGEQIGLNAHELEELRLAALLHDVGKLGVPSGILDQPRTLTDQEWQQVRRSPDHAERILQPLAHIGDIVSWIRHEHERPDGQGYPDGLNDDRIPLGSRIVAVADAFDAMTSERPYRRALSDEEALMTLADNAGRQFDRDAVQAFLAAYAEGKIHGGLSEFDPDAGCN